MFNTCSSTRPQSRRSQQHVLIAVFVPVICGIVFRQRAAYRASHTQIVCQPKTPCMNVLTSNRKRLPIHGLNIMYSMSPVYSLVQSNLPLE